MNADIEPDGFDYRGTIIRPPSEADSILIQATLGCSHGKCTFCGTYRDKRFGLKQPDTLMRDLAFARRWCRRQNKLFIMDGDAMVMPMPRLTWLLEQIREQLPWVRRVGMYANHKSVRHKSDADLAELARLGLGIVYYGVESGDDLTLARIRKGTDSAGLLREGLRLKAAGMRLSVTVLLGIAERDRWREHARATGDLLTRMDPDYVGALTVMIIPGTPLATEQAAGEFSLPTPREALAELREMVASTHLSRGMFFSNHASNYLPLKVRYPDGRDGALKLLDEALAGRVGLRPEWSRGL